MALSLSSLIVLRVSARRRRIVSRAGRAGPAEDRVQLVEFFEKRFPGVPLEDYVYGALIANPGGREQYEQIMEFPPFLGDIEKGKKIWDTPFRNGRSFADCFPRGGHNVVGNYPYFDERLGKVVSFENAINACLHANGEAELAYGEREPMGVLTAYARTLSDGMRISIRVDSPRRSSKVRSWEEPFLSPHRTTQRCLRRLPPVQRRQDHAHGDHFPSTRPSDALADLPRRRGADDIPGAVQALHGADAGSALRFRQRGVEQPGIFPHLSQQRLAAEVCGFSQVMHHRHTR